MIGGALPNENSTGDMVGAFFTREPNPLSFAIEVWTKKAGLACAPGGGPVEWGYFAGFNVRNGMLDGDLTIENGPLTLGLKGELYAASGWLTGPYTDKPLENVLGAPDGVLRYIGITTVQPPDETAGCVGIGVTATGATAGIPGAFTPAGATPPATLAALTSAAPPIVASPATAWTVGQYVALGDASHAHWSSTAWVTGNA